MRRKIIQVSIERTQQISRAAESRKRVQRKRPIPGAPRLWNASRRIKTAQGLMVNSKEYSEVKKNPKSEAWRGKVSTDVEEYIDKNKLNLLPEEKLSLLRQPSIFFSRPRNVPVEARRQVYFPDFTIALLRTPHLPPKYASFTVPLWFNKLDLKSYLSSLYNVQTLHVRSAVYQSKVSTRPALNFRTRGRAYRPQSKKRMTAELVEPFVWPEEIKDFSEWEKDAYWKVMKDQQDQPHLTAHMPKTQANGRHRKSIAQQARELLEGKTKWSPTWQSMPMDVRVMGGSDGTQPPAP